MTARRRALPQGAEIGARSAGERIQKVLARAGLASRREAERWLAEGRISVNGAVVTLPGTRVDPDRDHIKVDGRRIRPAGRRVYYLLNKPTGCVTTSRDPQGRPIVLDLVGRIRNRVFPVGRLDFNTSGLLLLTNDGDLAEKILRPGTGCRKVYRVKVRGVPDQADLDRLAAGIVVEGRRTLPCRLRITGGGNNAWLEVALNEGRRNQIRKMLDQVGHPVVKLHRVAIGPLNDRGLAPGHYRALSESEVNRLREAVT